MRTSLYLDHNATTPVLPEVVEAMRACYAEPLFNPASQHEFGQRARRVLEDARERIAELLGAKTAGTEADRLVFTSGGTEANNLAICGLAEPRVGTAHEDSRRSKEMGDNAHPTRHLIISALEHPSISRLADELARTGWQVARLRVDAAGVIRVDDLANLLRPETCAVATMLGQNETGVLQPVAEIAEICATHRVPLHTDAAQVAGKVLVDFRALGVATMTIAAHKFHGPPGIGALLVRHGVTLRPQLFGGFQQAEVRPGSESVALAVGMCRALELWHADQDARARRMQHLRDSLERQIIAGWPAAVVIGRQATRLPHTSNIAFVGIDRQALFMSLDQAGVACSTGSACASGSSEPSPAHLAMGLSPAVIASALRFSLGATTIAAEVDEAARRIVNACNNLRPQKQG